MEGTVTIPIAEYELLTGIKKDFDEKLKSELKRMNDGDRAFVLRDRDEYVRRNERLLKENSEKAEELRKVAEMNVKLRLDLQEATSAVARAVTERAIAQAALDTAESELKNREEDKKTFLDSVSRLREERGRALARCDALLDRGLFARIFNRRPWK